jgi:hypothetical protein
MKTLNCAQRGLTGISNLLRNTRWCLSALSWICVVFVSLILISGRSFGTPTPPCEYSESPSCAAGSVVLTNLAMTPTIACLGSAFTPSITQQVKNANAITNYVYEDCSTGSVTNGIAVNILSNAWAATVGSWSAGGADWPPPSFTPGDCRIGSITITTYWMDGCSTNLQTASASTNFTVVSVASATASGATEIDDGDNNPNTKAYVTCKGSGNVTVTATSCPNLSEESLPSCWSTSGGSGSEKLARSVSKNAAGSTTITFSAGLVTRSVTICVVDAGTTPTGVGAVNYVEHFLTTSAEWGEMTPNDWNVDITAYFDCASAQWKCKVTQADSHYDIFYHLKAGVQEASVAAATTGAILCKMKADLAVLANIPGIQWYMIAAVEAHERVHVDEWKGSLNPRFTTMKTTIEALTVPHVCGRTAASAKALIKAMPTYTSAVNTAYTDATTAFIAIPDPNSNTDAAEHAVVDPMINALEAKRVAEGWAVCP